MLKIYISLTPRAGHLRALHEGGEHVEEGGGDVEGLVGHQPAHALLYSTVQYSTVQYSQLTLSWQSVHSTVQYTTNLAPGLGQAALVRHELRRHRHQRGQGHRSQGRGGAWPADNVRIRKPLPLLL